jgi:hypothetical protein
MCDISDLSEDSQWLDSKRLTERYDDNLIEAFITISLLFFYSDLIQDKNHLCFPFSKSTGFICMDTKRFSIAQSVRELSPQVLRSLLIDGFYFCFVEK